MAADIELHDRIREHLDILVARDSAFPIERMAAQWAHEVSDHVGVPCVVIPTVLGVVAYAVPTPRTTSAQGRKDDAG